MYTRAVRGAIQLRRDDGAEMAEGVQRLVTTLLKKNEILENSIVSILFTQTKDLVSENPARALRQIGFADTPLFCSQEPDYAGAFPHTIRVLITVNRDSGEQLEPVYLEGAASLRPDLKRG